MELFFNLFWLLIALASFVGWRRVVRVRRGTRGRVRAALPVLALVCALAILFPTISVSDNLHPKLFVTEDGSASRRAMIAIAGTGHGISGHQSHASPPALIPSLVLPFRFELIAASFCPAYFPPPLTTFTRTLPSRAPPTL